ncbi:MAG: hypothetical protein A3J55_04325 [Candidatus Ryanbacteria bacterium RIFCSPHIGHO2_02_FULL_45_17b]|uniref:Transglutaminase-like domain-containing protein n=1 Tax=Candidatus Ryanbacteria bacterium RIFCSPHIGHO2_01_FULL_45_22 TaxID=1802114 RepID=A0A1G2G3A2_9BACT|nr:MAG: hypothetical protein A2719_04900 [Candidatus Ryanbacteria bacterium RIFCSPHIGHO2_01_FULL_45_22]OGZ47572.1 MAG: hypothetical protein A3J55_04325 [Candidatus Ryanbacteria bacterium RIFCSPHIGHO2_02_FULL_45_17b]
MHGFDAKEIKVLRSLRTPVMVQDFLNLIPGNFEEQGNTLMSPRRVMREKKAHCMEGALLAAAVFWIQGRKPLLLDLRAAPNDDDHVVALFQDRGLWGAVSKTNHAVLRWREPIFKTVHALAASYFHEYFLDDGRRTLREYSRPFRLDVKKYAGWTVAEKDLWHLSDALDASRHYPLLPRGAFRYTRLADNMERKAGNIVEWKRRKINLEVQL